MSWPEKWELSGTNWSNADSRSWGFTIGGDKTGHSASAGNPGIAKATAFADLSGYGGNKHWATVGRTFTIPDQYDDDRMGKLSISKADLQGEVWGVGATGEVNVNLTVVNKSKDITRSVESEKFVQDVAWAQEIDKDLDASIDINLYPGDEYLAKVSLDVIAEINTLVGGVGSADCGPFDGDDNNDRGLRVWGFVLEPYDE